jgi:spore coat polysaccharide biosynthesis protein SpsF (cytidylyltransferase family)
MFAHLVTRLRRARRLDGLVLATTAAPQDDELVALAARVGVPAFRGSEEDVLDRFYRAAEMYAADVIVRICADCPLMDPVLVDAMVEACLSRWPDVDYVSNVHPPTYPDGLDIWVFSQTALARAWREATKPSEREHVTPYLVNHPTIFRIYNVACNKDLSHWRLTVDYLEDFRLVETVFSHFNGQGQSDFGLADVISFLERRPDLARLNRGIMRDEGYLKSLTRDSL